VKRLLLLFIPLIFFFGCDPDDDDAMLTYNCINDDCFAEEGGQYGTLEDCLSVCGNNTGENTQNIVGVWKDDFDSNIIITLSEGDCPMWVFPETFPNDPLYFYCVDTSYFESINYLLFHNNTGNNWAMGSAYCGNGEINNPILICDANDYSDNSPYQWYSEILTIYENNEWSYSVVSMCFNLYEPYSVIQESCENATTYPSGLDPLEIALAPISSSEPYANIKEGTWVAEGGLLKLTSSDGTLHVFAYEFDGGSLTLDQSLNGQVEYITVWEQ
jgi:hypothetical protein